MKEILFRGKTETGEWAQGYYVKGAIRHCIVKSLAGYPQYDVIPDTVGQFTGLTDKNATKIFEGDIVKYSNGYGHIAWAELHVAFMCVEENGEYWEWISNMYDIEVVGNIHDNPELLGGDSQ